MFAAIVLRGWEREQWRFKSILVLFLALMPSAIFSQDKKLGEGQVLPSTAGTDLAFSTDGRYLLTAGGVSARVWDLKEKRPVGLPLLQGGDLPLLMAKMDPIAKRVLTIAGNEAWLWDIDTGRRTKLFVHPTSIWSASVNADWSRLVTAGEDRVARVWDISTGKEIVVKEHPQPVRFVTFSRDGQSILSISSARGRPVSRQWLETGVQAAAVMWDSTTGRSRYEGWSVDDVWALELKESPSDARKRWRHVAAFSPDGKTVATLKDGYVEVRDVLRGGINSFTRSNVPFGGSGGVLFHPGSETFATLGGGLGFATLVDLWKSTNGERLRTMDHSYNAQDYAFSPDGNHLLLIANRNDKSMPAAKGTGVWQVEMGKQIFSLTPNKDVAAGGPGGVVAYSQDGLNLAVGVHDKVRIWSKIEQ